MNYQDAYVQDKKRKLSQVMDKDAIKETILNVEQQEDLEALMEEHDIDNIATHASELETESVEELQAKNRALLVIEEFLQQENLELKKFNKEILKENQVLKNVLKNDFQSNFKYIKKDY
ncbi:hypothetical protein PVL30_003064 [Lodderomyces elongisporus]|uniref:uncharacterized protein n=1 Tax=Lodderomyces elongisporus TaxID=36914 RepID=UPI002922C7B5|nr:uncharacterized protein PVL30_003064 [Lodderomyces elongisporus]WLF79312.1 hypothetical protein PVL30_003064 [Lodderomyces elongisporus]